MANSTYNDGNQIAVYKTNKCLAEFTAKLNPADVEHYAKIFADGSKQGDRKVYSVIGINLLDYSGGKGDKSVFASDNLQPEEIDWLHAQLCRGVLDFELRNEKIIDKKDEQGYSPVKKLCIRRTDMRNGSKAKYPWCIECENGLGIAKKTQTGGTYCAANTFKSTSKVIVNLSDYDFFSMIDAAKRYIDVFALTYGPKLIRDGIAAARSEQS